jgi:hypothetical protein
MKDEIRIPDIEIIVGAAGNDIAVVCFFARNDIHQGYEVVSAVSSSGEVPAIRQILQDAITALNTADWHSLDELYQEPVEGDGEPPF